eukprot:COSAG01_NODE_199_length_22202_cov_23.993668_26_plen_135_part_00
MESASYNTSRLLLRKRVLLLWCMDTKVLRGRRRQTHLSRIYIIRASYGSCQEQKSTYLLNTLKKYLHFSVKVAVSTFLATTTRTLQTLTWLAKLYLELNSLAMFLVASLSVCSLLQAQQRRHLQAIVVWVQIHR